MTKAELKALNRERTKAKRRSEKAARLAYFRTLQKAMFPHSPPRKSGDRIIRPCRCDWCHPNRERNGRTLQERKYFAD